MTLGESNLERNSLEIFLICLEEEGEPEACKEIAIDYAEDKAESIRSFFAGMQNKAEELGDEFKEYEYKNRRSIAIPDALARTRKKLNELTEEISV